MAEKKQRSNMATARFGSGKGNTLRIEFNEVDDVITEIKIHLVRIFNDGLSVISLVCLDIGGVQSFYTSVTNDETSPAEVGEFYGYLLRRNDDGDTRKQIYGDSKSLKIRIDNVLKNIVLVDERLPKEFQKGGYNTQGHNGIRIFEPNMKAKQFPNWYRLEGGNRFIHTANYAYQVIGCEGLGFQSGEIEEDEFGVSSSNLAMGKFLDKIVSAYEKDITKGNKTRISISVEKNIQPSIKEFDVVKPEELYKKLYKPREIQKPIILKPNGIKKL